MKNNVIISAHQIEFGNVGILAIMGTFPGRVLFMVRDGRSSHLDKIETQKYMLNPIFAYTVDTNEPMYFFEYKLNGELRNPQKLLKSVRNKLMGAINASVTEEHEQHAQEIMEYQYREARSRKPDRRHEFESPTDAFYDAFKGDDADNFGPIPKVCY